MEILLKIIHYVWAVYIWSLAKATVVDSNPVRNRYKFNFRYYSPTLWITVLLVLFWYWMLNDKQAVKNIKADIKKRPFHYQNIYLYDNKKVKWVDIYG